MAEVAERSRNRKKNHQGKLLRLMRTQKSKTQEQVARDNQLTQSRIYELELMETVPDEYLKKFAEYYGVSVDFLKTFDLDEAAKNFTYNNSAALSDQSIMNAPQADSLNIINPESSKDLKEAYEEVAKLNRMIGKIEGERDMYKKLYEEGKNRDNHPDK